MHRLRPLAVPDLDALLEAAAGTTGTPCRRVLLDNATPAWVEAELLARDWRTEHQLQLVLRSDIITSATPGAYRVQELVPDDWTALQALFRIDHDEEDRRASRPSRPRSDTDDALDVRRGLTPPARYFIARQQQRPVGFVAGWPGAQGLGVIEDVFVHPDHRHRGIASLLISRAANWTRHHGAGPVLIAADPTDTPKHLYAGLGFTPTAVTRSLLAPTAPS